MPVHVRVLGSSSSGNCTVVWNERSALLIDCGFSPRYIVRHLKELHLSFRSLDAVLITHTHGDHVHAASLRKFCDEGVPIVSPDSVLRVLAGRFPILGGSGVRSGRELLSEGAELGPFAVTAFPVPHDAQGGCYGYRIVAGEGEARRTVTLATDLGFVEETLLRQFAGSDALVIESNHDLGMLERSGRPAWLKDRIRSIGHLSNEQCAGFVLRTMTEAPAPPRAVVLAHISRQCNTRDLAVACTANAVRGSDFGHIPILPSYPWQPNEIVAV